MLYAIQGPRLWLYFAGICPLKSCMLLGERMVQEVSSSKHPTTKGRVFKTVTEVYVAVVKQNIHM